MDSVVLRWGSQRGSQLAAIENPFSGRKVDGPADLDLRREVVVDELAARHGASHGEVQSRIYPRGESILGHWKFGPVDLMVSDTGKAEVRASLPNLYVGRNDIVLTVLETRLALELLALVARMATGCSLLTVENARLCRADFCVQTVVASVSHVLKALERAWSPPRRAITTTWVAKGMKGGRSLVFGYGTPYVIRLYDKNAERASKGQLVPDELFDRLLRIEVQERRAGALEGTRREGYSADTLMQSLRSPFERWPLIVAPAISGEMRPRARLEAMAHRYLAEHPELLASMRNAIPPSEWWRYSKGAREAAATELDGWTFEIPDDLPQSGMAPEHHPEIGHHYPTAEQIAEHERELQEKRERTLEDGRRKLAEYLKRETRVPTEAELERYRREARRRRYNLEADELVLEWRRDNELRVTKARAQLHRLEQESEQIELDLFRGQLVFQAKGELARQIANGTISIDG